MKYFDDDLSKVAFVLEDAESNVTMYRRLGLCVLQVFASDKEGVA